MKKTVLRIVKAVLFCSILVTIIAGASVLLERKESREKLTPFYERAEQTDVLLLGDSHMLSAVYPLELWRDYGITAYNLASYNNTLPVSYWLLRCALDVCTPKAVVVDINYINCFNRLSGSSGDVHTAFDGLPMSRTKLAALDDLMSDPEEMDDYGNRYVDLKKEYIFPLALYHSRWSELSEEDIHPSYSRYLGAQMQIHVAEPAEYAIVADAVGEQGYGFVYLRRIVEECRSRGIGVLLTNVPYPPAGEDDQAYSNAVYYVAQELGVEYIDFVYMDQIVDYATDCYDPNSHLNPSGARKVTDYLGQILSGWYDVPDHRGEAGYARWDSDYDAYVNDKMQLLREQTSIDSFLMMLHDPDFSVCLSIPEGSGLYEDECLMRLVQNIGRRHLFEEDTYDAVFADGLMPLERLMEAAATVEAYMAVIDRGSGEIREALGGEAELEASFGGVQRSGGWFAVSDGKGLQRESGSREGHTAHIAVIDERTDEIVMVREYSL